MTSHLRFVGDLREESRDRREAQYPLAALTSVGGGAPAILASLLLGFGAHAQAPNSEDVADGMRLYRQKGDCQACHGWAADGRKMDTQMPDGANL